MLTESDKIWLSKNYPSLSCSESDEISGIAKFSATYNEQTGLFLVLNNHTENTVGGLRIDVSFAINIKETNNKSISKLPALYIDGIEGIPDRHFHQTVNDRRACLCSPFIEDQFLVPNFKFKKYFEELVLPFLYGQAFYTINKRWPWQEWSHGLVGLLESYITEDDSTKAKGCVDILRGQNDWLQIKTAILQKTPIKGHIYCFCKSGNRIRNCHIDAWKGAEQLRQDIKIQGLVIS
jgi:hypothetical protein